MSSTSADYRRTAIRKLSIRRYRSLEHVVLEDLPNLIVIYGPNGSGKSNLLRAVQLALRAVAIPDVLPMKRQDAITMQLQEADQKLDLRPDDFRFGDLPEIRVELSLELGPRAHAIALLADDMRPSIVDLEVVFQLDGTKAIRFWFERAEVDGVVLGMPEDQAARSLRNQILQLQHSRDSYLAMIEAAQTRLNDLQGNTSQQAKSVRNEQQRNIQSWQDSIRNVDDAIQKLNTKSVQSFYAAERIQRVLLPRLVQTSDAYRVPGAKDDPQAALYSAFLSEDPNERDAAHRFGKRLAKAGLFGAKNEDVPLIPVDSRTYGEKQIRFRHPTHGELSLRNLGSGEQQLVLLLAQRVITPFPITQIEEPEAHLHLKLMEKLAPILRESVLGDGDKPDVDQLWMATHHHLFAISDEFFDVSLDERGSTSIVRRKRDEVAKHFYEPSPYWDTLRTLVDSGLDSEAVVSLDEQGNPITAKQVLESIHGDRKLANQFVKAATEAFVLSLAKDGSDS